MMTRKCVAQLFGGVELPDSQDKWFRARNLIISERQIDLGVILEMEIILLSVGRMSCSMDKRIFSMIIILHIHVCVSDLLQAWKRYKDILENRHRYNF